MSTNNLPTSVGVPEIKPIAVMPGCLYLVATPIGNLGDLSPRAAAVLAAVDRIAAEDTRRTLRLLNALGVHKPMISYHEHNVRTRGPVIIQHLQAGEAIALVSDAGMPCISDPGEDLVSMCIEQGIPITVIPGPTAALSALALSGLNTSRFAFEGFLPASGRQRRQRLASLVREPRTMILYEAPHRLIKLLIALHQQGLGERRLVLARELTKRFEEVCRSTVTEIMNSYTEQTPRGEFVVVLEGSEAYTARNPGIETEDSEAAAGRNQQIETIATDDYSSASAVGTMQLLQRLLAEGLSVRDAAQTAARQTGLRRSELYAQAQTLKERSPGFNSQKP